MSQANDLSSSVTPISPVVVPTITEKPEPKTIERAPWKNPDIEFLGRTTVWDVPFDLVTLRQSIDHIGRLIEVGTPSYVITANLNYVMLHHQNEDLQTVTRDADLILAVPKTWIDVTCLEDLDAVAARFPS